MAPPLALRLARLLLVAAGALAFGTATYIAAQTQSVALATPWLALLAANGAAFVAAAVVLGRDPTRGAQLAVGAALTMAALGTLTGMGAGVLGFPAMALGALGAWAALAAAAERPRSVLYAFLVYLAIGLAISMPTLGVALLYPIALSLVVIWPIRLLLVPSSASFLAIYVALALGIGVLLLVLARRRAFVPDLTVGLWLTLGVLSLLVGVAAVAFFNVYAIVRANTSARFEIDGLVLFVVFVGGLLTALGVLVLRLRPGALGAFSLGFGAVALFLAFTHPPAVTCYSNGGSTAVPLAWELRGIGSATTWTSGGAGGTVAPGSGGQTVQTGELRRGDRVATYRCEGDLLVDYREVR
ncbi:MAG: hypothetical protein KGN00_05095 [Chloroflexota bacterium]|nr:hypothetical protein [Chloroflexota bacterium]